MAFEIEGTIKVIMETQTFGSGFTKREFVLTIGDDRYPQDIKMEFVKDKTSLLDKYKVGQRVKIGFDLRGGLHNERYYVSVQAWRIHPAEGGEAPAAAADGGESRREPGSGGYAGAGAAPRSDRPRPDRGGGDDRGGRPDRGAREDDRRPRRQEEYRGGGGRRGGNSEDDIDF